MVSILIQHGKIIDPTNQEKSKYESDILIENGKITKIEKELDDKNIDTIINAQGKIVTSGLVDMHVHLREPGREDKETIATATRAAAKGGVTTLLGMPNTTPAIDNQAAVRFVFDRARETGMVKVLVAGSLTKNSQGNSLAEIWELRESGVSMIIDDAPQSLSMKLKKLALEYCQTFDMPLMAHAEETSLAEGAVMAEGFVATQMGLSGSPASTESLTIARTLELLRETPVPYHFTHLSTQRGVELIREAKKQGLPITADTTPHHLALTDEECLNYNTSAKVAPPLRSENNRAALIEGLLDNTIDAIASDHAPHLLVEKFVPFVDAAVGIAGIETLFAVSFTELVKNKKMSLPDLIAKLTVNPAKIIRAQAGELKIGALADLTIFDIETEFMIDKNSFESKGRNTPFHGKKVFGRASEILVNGELKMMNGKLKT
jgi:dihydroorotase